MERKRRLHDSYDLMRLRYVTQGKSPEDIAKEFGVTPMTIYRALKKHNLRK